MRGGHISSFQNYAKAWEHVVALKRQESLTSVACKLAYH